MLSLAARSLHRIKHAISDAAIRHALTLADRKGATTVWRHVADEQRLRWKSRGRSTLTLRHAIEG